jgi:integrase
MYLVGNRCGLRPGEVSGLRLSDLADLSEGRIRVRFSEDGPLKEDKGDGPAPKVKWAPAPDDVQQLLASWLARREAEKAESEQYVFPAVGGGLVSKMQRSRAWRALPAELRGAMTWYEASRHSFASRNLEAGVPLEEVSGALGHSTPAVTLRHYSRFVRKDYSDAIRRPLKLVPADGAKVIPLPLALGQLP